MSVEQYSDDVIVVTIADGPANFKVWLRDTFETRQAAISELAPQDACGSYPFEGCRSVGFPVEFRK